MADITKELRRIKRISLRETVAPYKRDRSVTVRPEGQYWTVYCNTALECIPLIYSAVCHVANICPKLNSEQDFREVEVTRKMRVVCSS